MLRQKMVYSDIVAATGASTATISRVNRSLQYGCNGYDEIFKGWKSNVLRCFLPFYDSLTDNVEYEKRAEYFCGLLSICRKEKGILLDLGCGTGGISIEAAKRDMT